MSGVWIFNKNGVARLVPNPTMESATSLGARRRVLVYLPCNQLISSYAELEQCLEELGWKRYCDGPKHDELVQFHRSETSAHLISLPKSFSDLKSMHMYDVVVKNINYFEVRDHMP